MYHEGLAGEQIARSLYLIILSLRPSPLIHKYGTYKCVALLLTIKMELFFHPNDFNRASNKSLLKYRRNIRGRAQSLKSDLNQVAACEVKGAEENRKLPLIGLSLFSLSLS
jgi:hypothetical protein